jgi:2-polyprenyl-3-methyl-5-hydroxy-6-metoxy-1,4-benzoquinol methylase
MRMEIINLIPANAVKILDIGCAAGGVGLLIKEGRACEIIGIEIDNEKAKIASSKLDKVIVGNVETIDPQLKQGYFDCMIFADVLEHLREPSEVLKKYSHYLKEDGCFIISIPNVRHVKVIFDLVVLGEWRYEPFGIMDRTHMRFFTLKSFRRLMQEAQVIPVSIDRIFSLKGSRLFNLLTLGLFKDILTAQYVFLAKKKHSD